MFFISIFFNVRYCFEQNDLNGLIIALFILILTNFKYYDTIYWRVCLSGEEFQAFSEF